MRSLHLALAALVIWFALLLALRAWPPPTVSSPDGSVLQVHAGIPFVEHDPGGANLGCVSDRSGRVLPPFLTH